jgi:hypothetical protein
MNKQEIESFRKWHETRLAELNYPPRIVEKLRADREKWFQGVAK